MIPKNLFRKQHNMPTSEEDSRLSRRDFMKGQFIQPISIRLIHTHIPDCLLCPMENGCISRDYLTIIHRIYALESTVSISARKSLLRLCHCHFAANPGLYIFLQQRKDGFTRLRRVWYIIL